MLAVRLGGNARLRVLLARDFLGRSGGGIGRVIFQIRPRDLLGRSRLLSGGTDLLAGNGLLTRGALLGPGRLLGLGSLEACAPLD
jgi:hypothetical protein